MHSCVGDGFPRRAKNEARKRCLLYMFLATFKLKKLDYQKEGFDPYKITDSMFYLDPKSGQYEVLNKQAHDDICSGKIRF